MQEEDFGDGGEGPGRLCLCAPAASSHRALQQPQLPPRVAGPGLVGGGHTSPSSCMPADLGTLKYFDLFFPVNWLIFIFCLLNQHLIFLPSSSRMMSRFIFHLNRRNLHICPESGRGGETMKCTTEAWRTQIAASVSLHT